MAERIGTVGDFSTRWAPSCCATRPLPPPPLQVRQWTSRACAACASDDFGIHRLSNILTKHKDDLSVNLLLGTGELPASPASLFAARSFRTLKLVEEQPSASMATVSASSVAVEKPHTSSAKAASTAEARASSVSAAVGKKVRQRFIVRASTPVNIALMREHPSNVALIFWLLLH